MTSESLTSRLQRSLSAVSLADKVVYGLVGLFFLAGLVAQPLWGVLDPRLPLSEAYEANTAADPWGRPWAETMHPIQDRLLIYSVGPNGIDEEGSGDDMQVYTGLSFSRLDLYRLLGVAFLAASALLAGGWELGRAMRAALTRPRSPSLFVEVRRAALLSLPFGVLLAAAGVAGTVWLDEYLTTLEDLLVVAPSLAAAGSAFVLSFMAVFWLRLRQPLEEEAPAPA